MSIPSDPTMSFGEAPDHEFSLEQTADLTGLEPDLILEYLQTDLLRVRQVSDSQPSFDQATLVRLRHIAVLRHDEISLPAIRYILDLVDRLEATDRELRALRERLR